MSCKSPLEKAIELIDAGNNIFITGGGGVGKSYLLNQLKKHYGDDLKITSTTGVSAYNIAGQTIHSFAGIYKNKIYLSFPDTKRKLTKNLKECRILAIDEVSMLHKETLDSLNSAFKEITGNRNKPFGGIQMIFIGDFFQLPPVPQKTNRYSKSKNAEYCFKSHAWEAGKFITLDLQEVKRQSDKKFISALNKVRTGNITQDVIDLFEEREKKFDIKADSKTLCIFSKKEKMNKHNDNMLKEDDNCSGAKSTYTATDYYCETIDKEKQEYIIPVVKKGDIENKEYIIAKAILERECRYPKEINIRNGCRVMLLKNLDQAKGLVNGSCGVVKSHSDDEVIVKFDKVNEEQVIKKDSFYFQYRYIEDEKTGQVIKNGVKRVQFPLQLAYAITIHKSQGMTFDELVVDLENVFDKGMSYVALSRNRTLENLYIRHFKSKEIKTSQEVIDFYNNLKNCITFTEDGEMIEKLGETIEEENKDTISPSSETIIISKVPETEDDEYNDPMGTNEYSDGYEYSIALNTEKINSDPNNCMYLNYRAEAYYGNQEYENALNDLNKILKIDPEYEIDYFKKAYVEHKTDNNQQAIEDYTEYLKYNPNCAAAYNNRGWAKECCEYCNYKDAIEDYSEAINLDSCNCRYLNNRARAYYWNQEYENALNDWNKVLAIDPNYKIDYSCKVHAESEIAEIDYDNEDYEKAVDKWNEILKTDPEHQINYFDKAYAESEIKQYENAISDYTIYIDNNPDSSAAYNNRGVCKHNQGDYEGAINDYNKFLELEPNDCICLNNRANAYYKNNEYEKAINDWNEILNLDSEYEINYYSKAYAEKELGLFEVAILSIEKELNKYPDDEDALNLKSIISENLSQNDENLISEYLENAESYYEKEEYEKAVNEWNKILELNPDCEIDYFNKADAEYEIEKYSDSIDDYTKHLASNSDDAGAFNNRGLCKGKLKDYKDAIKDYNKAIKLEPKNPTFINNRADAYYWNDEYEKAVKDWNKVLKIDSKYPIYYFEKAYAENEIGLYEDAISSIEDYLNENPNNEKALNLKNTINDNLSQYNNEKLILEYIENAESYYENKEYKKAVSEWNKVLEINQEYNINYFRKAYAEDEIGQYSEAIDDYTKYLLIEPESDAAYNNRGWCKYNTNDSAGAINDYSEAIKLASNNPLYFNNRASVYYERKEYKKAINDWNKVLNLEPAYRIDYFNKSNSEYIVGLFQDAIISIDRYLDENPNFEKALDLKKMIKKSISKSNSENLISECIRKIKRIFR